MSLAPILKPPLNTEITSSFELDGVLTTVTTNFTSGSTSQVLNNDLAVHGVQITSINGIASLEDVGNGATTLEVVPTPNSTGPDLYTIWDFANGTTVEGDGTNNTTDTLSDIIHSDIKLFQSVNNNALSNSGVRSSVEILDGFLNNLFQGVSRVDALLGESAVKGVHVAIDSATTETYLDAHIMINRMPASEFITSWLVPSQDRTGASNADGLAYMAANRVYSMSAITGHDSDTIDVESKSIQTLNNPDPIYALQVGDIPIEVPVGKSFESLKGEAVGFTNNSIQINFPISENDFENIIGEYGFTILTTKGIISVNLTNATGGIALKNVNLNSNNLQDTLIFNVNVFIFPNQTRVSFTLPAGNSLIEGVGYANLSAFMYYTTNVVDGTEVTNTFPVRESTGVLELESDLGGLITSLNRLDDHTVEVTYTHDAAMTKFGILNLSESSKEIFVADDIVVLWQTEEIIESAIDGLTVNTTPNITYLDVINVNDNQRLDRSNFAVDFVSGVVTFISTVLHVDQYGNSLDDTSDYRIEYRVSEMLVIDSINSNTITTKQTITGSYPNGYLSSVILLGNLSATSPILFSQEIFNLSDPVWEDSRIGDNSAGQYNISQFPVELNNSGSINERWAVRFSSSNLVTVIGERTGTVLTAFNINNANALEPINPITGTPYFRLPVAGIGAGWNSGNVIRFNTTGASHHFYAGRTVLSGATANEEDLFQIEVRGDIG